MPCLNVSRQSQAGAEAACACHDRRLWTSPHFMRTSGTFALMSGVAVLMAGCAQAPHQNLALSSKPQVDPKYGVLASPRVALAGEKIHTGGGHYFVGRPYVVAGHTYYPSTRKYDKVGMASWYGADFHGRRTANGEVFSMAAISAASKTMPLPSYARVTNLTNQRSIIVRVNDRGPYAKGRIMDVSQNAATLLGFIRQGTARVHVQYLSPAPLGGHDTKMLMASLRTDGQPATLNGMALPPGTMLASNPSRRNRQVAMADLDAAALQQSGAAPRHAFAHVPLPPIRPYQITAPASLPQRHVALAHAKPHVEKVSFYDSSPIALSNQFVKSKPVDLTAALKMRPLATAQ